MAEPLRLDAALVARGLCASRTLARKAVESGRVSIRKAGHPAAVIATKAALVVNPDDALEVSASEDDQWVSRGALKLLGALQTCALDPAGLTCLDVGQSTGGFTDVLLQQGASRVVGIEVGHDQLHERLRSDSRVLCLEGINARDITLSRLRQCAEASTPDRASWVSDRGFDVVVVDVSFISLLKITPALKALIAPGGHGIWLVKPQFEVGPAAIGKGGLVRPDALGPDFERNICTQLQAQGYQVRQFMPSPITGGDGNREFFVWVTPES